MSDKKSIVVLGGGVAPIGGVLTKELVTNGFECRFEDDTRTEPLYQNTLFGKDDIFTLTRQNKSGGSYRHPFDTRGGKPKRVKRKHATANRKKGKKK